METLELVLMLLVGLVSAGCNNIQSSACGQNFGAIPSNTINGPYAFFGQSFSSSCRRSNCLNVDIIPVPLRELFYKQPIYKIIVENSAQNQQKDNICSTTFPVPDDDKSYFGYVSTVYTDGSNYVQSFVFTEVAPGVFAIANAEFTITQRVFATVGDNVYVTCTRTEFGNSDFPELDVLLTNSPTPLGPVFVQQIQQILNNNGLNQGFYVLPYRLKPRCYTQPFCFVNNPFISPVNQNTF